MKEYKLIDSYNVPALEAEMNRLAKEGYVYEDMFQILGPADQYRYTTVVMSRNYYPPEKSSKDEEGLPDENPKPKKEAEEK